MMQRAKSALLKAAIEQTPERIVLDIQRIKRYNRLIHSYILRLAYSRLAGGGDMPSRRRIERALSLLSQKRIGARVALGAGLEALRDRDGLVVQRAGVHAMASEVEVGVPIFISGTPWQLLVADEVWDGARTLSAGDKCSEYVDTASIEGRLRVRWPRAGDVFYPLGMRRPKKVHDFFADSKVPIRRRATTPVLECDNGIVWVCGFRIDDRFKVTGKTKNVLHLQLIKSS
jgi:tRNA(Ile)-lysidine synthase